MLKKYRSAGKPLPAQQLKEIKGGITMSLQCYSDADCRNPCSGDPTLMNGQVCNTAINRCFRISCY